MDKKKPLYESGDIIQFNITGEYRKVISFENYKRLGGTSNFHENLIYLQNLTNTFLPTLIVQAASKSGYTLIKKYKDSYLKKRKIP